MAARVGPDVQRASLDGIPVFWVDAPAPCEAELVFRVGRADETFPSGGITHLVEHLAMPAEPPRFDCNAWVTDIITSFWGRGSLEEVVGFVQARAEVLAALPVERLDMEKKILATEEVAGGVDPVVQLFGPRFGAVGFGLAATDQYGLRRLAEDDVLGWAARYFVRENAAVWLKGPFSPFRLELAAGERSVVPEARPIGIDFPAWVADWFDGVHITLLSRRSPETATFVSVFERRANQRLRFQDGLVYGVDRRTVVLGPDLVQVATWAQCRPEHAEAVRDVMLELLDELAARGPTAEELAHEVDAFWRGVSDPISVSGVLAGHANEELMGVQFETIDHWGRRVERVTAESVAETLRASLQTAILALPPGVECPDERFTRHPISVPSRPVGGQEFKRRGLFGALHPERLVVGPEGATYVWAEGGRSTVRFAECAAVLAWPDGSRALVGEDGNYFEVLPSNWRGGEAATRLIDAHVQADRVVPMSAADPLRSVQAGS